MTKASNTRRWKHRGITRAAAELGVERTHLWRVLLPEGAPGRRVSKRLLARYTEWISEQGTKGAA